MYLFVYVSVYVIWFLLSPKRGEQRQKLFVFCVSCIFVFQVEYDLISEGLEMAKHLTEMFYLHSVYWKRQSREDQIETNRRMNSSEKASRLCTSSFTDQVAQQLHHRVLVPLMLFMSVLTYSITKKTQVQQ